MVWDSFVKRCLARRAPALTSLYNKSIIAKQTLDTEVRKAEIQVASLMTKIQQADIASKQKQRSQGALASAKMAALQSEIQQISNQDQSYFDPNKGLCTIKMKLAQEERDKSQAKKESLEYDLKEMENIPESEAASAASSNAPSLADELKILEKATGYYTSTRNNLIASGKSDEEARKEACTGIGKRADSTKPEAARRTH
jgi:hypothetical protein